MKKSKLELRQNMGDDDIERPGAQSQFPIDSITLKRLCDLLKSKADTVLNEKASFTLTTDILNSLNVDCRRHSIALSEDESNTAGPSETNSWRPPKRVVNVMKKMDHKKAQNRVEWLKNIQFVKDFMLSAPNLKIIHNYGTLSFPIILKRFGNLNVLEIRKVPVHLIEGLQAVRGTLQSLTIVRSLSNVKDLLESCGGDRTKPLTWAKLKFLSLVFNNIHALDDSLRLVSHLEKLDLSHNQIDDAGKFMENLVDVLVVNLGYNSLTTIPSFSLTTRNSLSTLILRGNQLDNVQDIEVLTSLEVLDLGENYFVDHFFLLPLRALLKLKRLYLDLNPLFYHKSHRRLTVSFLSHRAISSEFMLDNKRLSNSEIHSYNPNIALKCSPRVWWAGSGGSVQDRPSAVPFLHGNDQRPLSVSSGIGTDDNSPQIIATSTPKKGGKRKRRKARDTEIRDLDTSGDFSSSVEVTPKGSPSLRNLEKQMREKREDALKTQREVEKLREEYGPNWLQAIEDQNIFNYSKAASSEAATEIESDGKGKSVEKGERTSPPMQYDENGISDQMNSKQRDEDDVDCNTNGKQENPEDEQFRCLKGEPTDDDLYLTDTNVHLTNNPIMAAIAKLASGQPVEHKVEEESDGDPERVKKALFLSSGTHTTVGVREQDVTARADISKNAEIVAMDKKSENSNSVSSNADKADNTSLPMKDPAVGLPQGYSDKKVSVKNLVADDRKDGDEMIGLPDTSVTSNDTEQSVNRSTDRSTSEMETSTDNSLQISVNENESEPIFVTLPESNNAMIIVTVAETFLVEKDVRGKVKEKLDLRSLVEMEMKQTKRKPSADTVVKGREVQDMGDKIGFKMVLKFSYVRKDRQRRCYLMDQTDGENLQGRVQPFIDAHLEKEKKKDSVIMQCLKCNRSFQKKELVHRSKELPKSGSSRDLKTLKKLMDTPTLICPRCGSNMLIEVESPTQPSVKSAGSTTSATHSSASNSTADTSQQQQGPPRKPAPMLRNRSFDHHSPQANLASRLAHARKSSLTSVDGLILGRRGNISLSSSPSSQSKVGSFTEGRERSNAFTASGQGGVSKNRTISSSSVSGKEEILHVEDHFGTIKASDMVVTASQELAEMTLSLRGDDSDSINRRLSDGKVETVEATMGGLRKTVMSDSGFESGVYSASPKQAEKDDGHSHPSSAKKKGKSNVDNLTPGDGKKEGRTNTRENKEKEMERSAEEKKKNQPGSKIVRKHKNLSAMADLVNSLVIEGNDMEEKELQKKAESESVHSLYSDDGRKSISVSELKRYFPIVSSATPRTSTGSVDSDIVALKRSGSGGSIAILNNGVQVNEMGVGSLTDGVSSGDRDLSVARFVIGSFDNNHLNEDGLRDRSTITGISSPLSSSICNSMVSSVYENFMADPTDGANNKMPLAIRSSVDSTGSDFARVEEVQDKGREEEDLTSIYDRPKQLKRTKKSKQKKSKSKASEKVSSERTNSSSREKLNTANEERDSHIHNSDKTFASHSNFVNEVVTRDDASYNPGSQSSGNIYLDAHSSIEQPQNSYGSSSVTIHGEEESFYEDGGLEDGGDEEEVENFTDGAASSELNYRFDRLDHRLTLYLMMSLFENHEEFLCKISCECVAYIVEESYPGLLVMSSDRFYILKVADHDASEEPDKWLSCVEVQPIPELRYVDIGLGGQSLRLEFVTDCSSYTLVTRNRNKTVQFVEVLHNHLAHYAVSHGIASNVMVNEDVDQVTLDNLNADVVSKVIPDQSLLLYVMGFIERGHNKKFPVSFVVSPTEMCLVRTNHQWPQPRLQPPVTVDTVGKQFTVLERQKINNVASVEVCELTLKRIRLELFDETEGTSTMWNITMATKQSTYDLIHAISEPWSREFGVDMDVSYSVLDFEKEEL